MRCSCAVTFPKDTSPEEEGVDANGVDWDGADRDGAEREKGVVESVYRNRNWASLRLMVV